MTDRAPYIHTEHFHLTRDGDAYGETLYIDRQRDAATIHLLQPFNDWAKKHFQPDENERRLCRMLEYAYQKGYKAAQADIRKAIGAPGSYPGDR